MPFMTCPRCQHRDHASGVETLPCTRPEHCPGIMVPVTYEPGRTLQATPPPVAAAPPPPACGAPPDGEVTGLPILETAGAALDAVTARAIELERQLADAQRDARDFQRAFEALQRKHDAAESRAAAAEQQLEALEADGFHARKPDRSWWACPECGPSVQPDEDGCCAGCGRDCAEIHAWDSGDSAAGGVSDVRAKLPDRLGRRAAIAGLVAYLVNIRANPSAIDTHHLRARMAARGVFLRELGAALERALGMGARAEVYAMHRDGCHAASNAPPAAPPLAEFHRDPKPDNMPDAAQAHQVGTEAERIRTAAGGALDAIGCRLGVFRPDGETDADYRPRLLRAVTQPVLQPVAAAPPTSRALEVIADMREVAELCSSGAGYGDEVRPMAVLGTLAALERRLTEAG